LAAKKGVFRHLLRRIHAVVALRRVAQLEAGADERMRDEVPLLVERRESKVCEKRISVLSAFTMFVPSLSWQNDHLSIKRRTRHALIAP
jgi:hypothetical protein